MGESNNNRIENNLYRARQKKYKMIQNFLKWNYCTFNKSNKSRRR